MLQVNKNIIIFATAILYFYFSIYSTNTGFIFAHSFGQTKRQIEYYKKGNELNWYILSDNSFSFNFPEVISDEIYNLKIDSKKANFGQLDDIYAIQNAYDNFKADRIVLVGCQRGAAAIINFAANNPERLAALILEAPYDSIDNSIQDFFGWLKWPSFYIFKRSFPAYNLNGVKPINLIAHIDVNIPILFIHSKKDKRISIRSSQRLYIKLKKSGHQNIFLLELEDGQHAEYQKGKDAEKYRNTVHAFLEKFNLPHNTKFAKIGKDHLNKCKPRCFHEQD